MQRWPSGVPNTRQLVVPTHSFLRKTIVKLNRLCLWWLVELLGHQGAAGVFIFVAASTCRHDFLILSSFSFASNSISGRWVKIMCCVGFGY